MNSLICMTTAPEILADGELHRLVGNANVMLLNQIGSSSDEVEVKWTSKVVDGRSQLQVSLEDPTGRASAAFSREELNEPGLVQRRIIRVWGDLLQIRSHKQIEAMSQAKVRPDGEDVLDMISDAIYDFTEKNGTQPHVLKLPTQYAVALMRLGSSFWGDFFDGIRETGVRALENKPLFGVSVNLVNAADAKLEVE
jgi:hypothetical protein